MKYSGMPLKKNLANIITSLRIIGTAVMCFMPTLSRGFYISYTLAACTDGVDGFVARRTHSVSPFGARLDSVADLFLFTAMMIKILPELIARLPHAVMVSIYAVVLYRLCLYIYVGIREHILLSTHTIFNKATSVMLFVVPFIVRTKILFWYAITLIALSVVSAAYETKQVFSGSCTDGAK